MVKRAIANPELMVICFCFTKKDVKDILKNLEKHIMMVYSMLTHQKLEEQEKLDF